MFRARHARKVFHRRRRRAAAALAIGLVSISAPGGCSGEEDGGRIADQRERQARDAAAEAGLPTEVQVLLGRAARAPAATFSATFTSGTERVAVHQIPPRRRVDVLVGGVARESYVTDGRTALRCEFRADAWTCANDDDGQGRRAPAIGAFSPELVARAVHALEDGAAAYTLDVHDLEVAGTAARCLRATPRAPRDDAAGSRLCVAPDGVPLLLDLGDGTPELRAAAYRPSADADDVRRPDET